MNGGAEMETGQFFLYLGVMAVVTYLVRAIPLALCRNKIENTFVKSFLAYVPYAVLGAMTFPAIIYSTEELIPALAGTVVGLVMAFRRKSLLFVAVSACVAVFIAKMILLSLC